MWEQNDAPKREQSGDASKFVQVVFPHAISGELVRKQAEWPDNTL
jgi:hypothetical protein